MFNLTEATRGWIYRVTLTVQPLVVAYGLMANDMASLWVGVVAAVLGLGLASTKTSVAKVDKDGA